MLVLSRRCKEAVAVGGADGFSPLLKVTVLEIRAGKVSLGFEIDAAVPVHRWEVWERICAGKVLDNSEKQNGVSCKALP
jgi:carbon storage regulator CsrA